MKLGTIFALALGHLAGAAGPADAGPQPVRGRRRGWSLRARCFRSAFITIACGAISGFHSLIASGTTPKILTRETYARPVGYGAMCLESLVAIMALIAACTLDPGIYFGMNVASTGLIRRPGPLWSQAPARCRVGPGGERARDEPPGGDGEREDAVRPRGRRGDAGGRAWRNIFSRRDQGPLAGPVVSLRHHVRGAVYPDDH